MEPVDGCDYLRDVAVDGRSQLASRKRWQGSLKQQDVKLKIRIEILQRFQDVKEQRPKE